MQTLTITRPDDMHLHLRDGDALQAVAPYTARQMGRAVIMPNLKPPVVSVADALAYKARIMAALPEGSAFEPLMTLYLTDQATPELVREAKAAGIVAFKLYPAGATTNSDSGVTDLFKLIPVLEEMAKQGILFLVHGEVTGPEIDIFDREAAFIERVMKPVLARVPNLKVVFEHITTAEAARLIRLLRRMDRGIHPRRIEHFLVHLDAHDNQIAIAVLRDEQWFTLCMAERRNLRCVSEIGNWSNLRHNTPSSLYANIA